MNEIFNANNPVMRFLTNLFNIFLVNALFIVTSLPIITMGASMCAVYKICLAMVSGDDPRVIQTYFSEFKASFKKGTLLWLIVLGAGGFFVLELYWIYFRKDIIGDNLSFLQYPVWILLLLVIQLFLYGFALLATFENTFKNTIINSIVLSIKHLPITVMLIAVFLFTPLLANTFQQFAIPILSLELFFNLALRFYICSVFLHRAFGLKKIKYAKNGEATEESYEDLIEVIGDEPSGSKDDDEDDPDEGSESDEDEDETLDDVSAGTEEDRAAEEESDEDPES